MTTRRYRFRHHKAAKHFNKLLFELVYRVQPWGDGVQFTVTTTEGEHRRLAAARW